MKTLSISLYNRPKYTKQFLNHLEMCYGIEEYKIFISCDPGNKEVEEMAKQFRPKQTSLVINGKRLGCNTNIFQSLAMGFAFNDYHIHFEDDTIPGKDCLLYFEWAGEYYKNNSEVFTISGYVNSNNKTEHYYPMNYAADRVSKRKWFTPWGWATWKDRFLEMKDVWDFQGKNGSWDCTIHNIVRKNRLEIFPIVSRVQNIGAEMGTHVPNADWHKLHHYNEHWIDSCNLHCKHFEEIE